MNHAPSHRTRARASGLRALAALACVVLWGLGVVLAPVLHSFGHRSDHHHLPGGAIVLHDHEGAEAFHVDPPPLLFFDLLTNLDNNLDAQPGDDDYDGDRAPPHGDGSFAHFAVGAVVPLPTLSGVVPVELRPLDPILPDVILPRERLWLTRGMARAPPQPS